MGKFLRIIDSKEYITYLRESMYRYIPQKLLYSFQEKINPRVICNYIRNDIDEVVGYGVGVFLKEDRLDREKYIKIIVDTINSFKEQQVYKDLEYLAIDNLNLSTYEIDLIHQTSSIKILDGRSIFLDEIMQLLKKVCQANDKDIKEQEILIISDDSNDTERISIEISSAIKFLTIYSRDEEFSKDLEAKVLRETGLSLSVIESLEGRIDRFDFIINLCDNIDVDINKSKKTTVVVDLSRSKVISNSTNGKIKKRLVIDDIFFKNDGSISCDRLNCDIEKEIDTYARKLYENADKDIVKIKIYDKIYSVKEGVNLYSFRNLNSSSFYKK